MDKNLNNKVYINPYFQGPSLTNTRSSQHCTNTNTNNHPTRPKQYDMVETEEKINRKIYFNPNFKQIKHQKELPPTLPEKHEKFDYIKAYPVLNSKSKYSLVSNFYKNKVTESDNYREGRDQNYDMNIIPKSNVINQTISTQKILNETSSNRVPFLKSRYTIVRKNNVPSENQERIKQQNCKLNSNCTMGDVTNRTSKLENCYNALSKQQENKVVDTKPFEHITKIKISKYKTVPLNYLKKNIPPNKEIKSTVSSQLYTNSDLCINKNKYKLTRATSKSNIEVTCTKTISQTCKKSLCPSKIKILKANYKVNNIPCQLFRKYGKCLRRDYGNCEFVHDKKHVSLCRKFLKGICHDSNCALSHELTANKMPTCYFYLKGVCIKENCPYLHIKLNDKIKICHNFLRGFCENGDTCQFRHVKVGQTKKSKICNLTSLDRYKSLLNKSTKLRTSKTKTNGIKKKDLTQLKNKKNIKPCNQKDTDVDCRYYKEIVTNEDSCNNIKPTRCKIGTLPSFIQL